MMIMMMVMFMDNWFSIMITCTIIFTAALSTMMFTVFVMVLWSWQTIAKCKRLTLCMIRVSQVICCKIQVLRTAPQSATGFTGVRLPPTVPTVNLMFVPGLIIHGVFLVHVAPLVNPLFHTCYFITAWSWWITFTWSSLHSLWIVIHPLWVHRIFPGFILWTVPFICLPLSTPSAWWWSAMMSTFTTITFSLSFCFQQTALWSDLTEVVCRWRVNNHWAFSVSW